MILSSYKNYYKNSKIYSNKKIHSPKNEERKKNYVKTSKNNKISNNSNKNDNSNKNTNKLNFRTTVNNKLIKNSIFITIITDKFGIYKRNININHNKLKLGDFSNYHTIILSILLLSVELVNCTGFNNLQNINSNKKKIIYSNYNDNNLNYSSNGRSRTEFNKNIYFYNNIYRKIPLLLPFERINLNEVNVNNNNITNNNIYNSNNNNININNNTNNNDNYNNKRLIDYKRNEIYDKNNNNYYDSNNNIYNKSYNGERILFSDDFPMILHSQNYSKLFHNIVKVANDNINNKHDNNNNHNDNSNYNLINKINDNVVIINKTTGDNSDFEFLEKLQSQHRNENAMRSDDKQIKEEHHVHEIYEEDERVRRQKDRQRKQRKRKGATNLEKLHRIIMQGLGLKSLPDVSKMNISQTEYITKYNEYLNRVKSRKKRELQLKYGPLFDKSVIIDENELSVRTYSHNSSDIHPFPETITAVAATDGRTMIKGRKDERERRSIPSRNSDRSHLQITYVKFPIKIERDPFNDVEEANLRLFLMINANDAVANKKKYEKLGRRQYDNVTQDYDDDNNNESEPISNEDYLHLKIYQLIQPYHRVWLDGKKVFTADLRRARSKWLEFDVTKAVKSWIYGDQPNLGLEIHCIYCGQNSAHIVMESDILTVPVSSPSPEGAAKFINSPELHKGSQLLNNGYDNNDDDNGDLNPILNIIGTFGTRREKRSRQHQHHIMMHNPRRKVRKTDCYPENHKCCRHAMEVVFKEVKGFEFIIQPKAFDAGYCKGKCPPRYNPANHHAILQSLIWKQDKKKVPRPCCAPSKLVELEVLHVDEKDNNKLKVSTWTDMRVLECACS